MPTRVKWTPELIRRFWDGVSQLPGLEHVSFANLASDRLIELFSDFLKPGMTCLDYGGGSGHFARALIGNGQKVAVYEPSDQRAHAVEERFADEPDFLGVVGPSDERRFDALLCMEVIEHIIDEEFAQFLLGLNKNLRHGGLLLLTTPYDETLAHSDVYCPECDSAFHRWQHVRSFDATTLRAVLRIAGFEPEEIALVGFNDTDALARFVRERRTGSWRATHRELSGEVFANVAAADHIFFAGRKRREADLAKLSIDVGRFMTRQNAWHSGDREPEPISAGVKAASLKAAVDLYTKEGGDNGEARWTRTALLEAGESAEAGAPARIAVFDGELEDLNALSQESDVRVAEEIHVRDSASWRQMARRERTPTPFAAQYSPDTALERVWRLASPQLMRVGAGRKLQAYFDASERRLQAILSDSEDFPFHNEHYVRGRVVLGISSLSSGGAERQTVYAATGLARRGHEDIHLVVDHLFDNAANSFYLPQVAPFVRTIHEVGAEDLSHSPWLQRHPGFWQVLGGYVAHRILNTAKRFQALAPEVVHTSLDWTNITMGLAAVLAGVPRIVVSGRNLSPTHFAFFNWFMYPAYRVLAAQPNVRLYNNSRAGAHDYADWLRLSRDSIAVVRNAVDMSAFSKPQESTRARARRRFNLETDGPVIASAFRLSPEKRPLLWIEAAAEVLKRQPSAQFLLFGDGPMRSKVELLAHRRRIADRVRICGITNDIRFAFAAADVVMLTSLQEGTPNVLIEAQAMGIPVITTPASGAAEAVEDHGSGRVINTGSAAKIAAAVLKVITDPGLCARMSARGPRWIEERFGAERMVDELLALAAIGGDRLHAPQKYREVEPAK